MIRTTPAFAFLVALAGFLSACADRSARDAASPATQSPTAEMDRSQTPESSVDFAPVEPQHQIATLGAGCFWCIEAVLEQVDGVIDAVSGYMGGHLPHPTYKQITTGTTGHAEVTQVTFDPSVLSYEHLLEWFWRLHDPTTLNRQGNDVGPQYRSVIFHHSEEQRLVATESRDRKDRSGEFADPIVTELSPAGEFYVAEEYHQGYYRRNSQQGYCRFVIAPKLEKLGLEK